MTTVPAVSPLTRKEFLALPNSEQRKLIAADVLAQIEAGKFVACPEVFVSFAPDPEWLEGEEANEVASRWEGYNPPLKARIATEVEEAVEVAEHCFVCGVGSLFVSLVGFIDRVKEMCPSLTPLTISGFGAGRPIMEYLSQVFTKREIVLIEAAFERGQGILDLDWDTAKEAGVRVTTFQFEAGKQLWANDPEYAWAIRFGEQFRTPHERLQAIMNRILEHPEGRFTFSEADGL